jgi:biopolymer transport protein ExbB
MSCARYHCIWLSISLVLLAVTAPRVASAEAAADAGQGSVADVGLMQALAVGQALSGDAAPGGPAAGGDDAGALNYAFIYRLAQYDGIVGYVIIFLSVVAVALIVDYVLLLRPAVLMPPAEIDELHSLVAAGRDEDITAERACFVGSVVAAGVAERGHGYTAMVKAMEDRADDLTGRLLRRIEYLNMIAKAAPMLGLLGTVIGMVQCFNRLSASAAGADPRLLGAGIFQSLMTTVMGLVVALPAFFACSIFRNRVGGLVADATATAEELVSTFRPAARQEQALPRIGRA